MFDNTFIDNFKKDFNPSSYIFKRFDSDKEWYFDWEDYYRKNIYRLNLVELFDNLIKEKSNNIELFFSKDYLEKYSNIEYYYQAEENENIVLTYFSLAEMLWNKCKNINKIILNYDNYIKLNDSQKIRLIPFLDDLENKFIKSVINEDFNETVNKKILKKLNYNLSEKNLLILYCRNDNIYLPHIKLSINNKLLQYALVYGSINVIELLDNKNLLENHNNPFDLSYVNYTDSVNDIWDGLNWGVSECEKIFISKNRSIYECAKICKKYFQINYVWFDNWISKCHYNNGYGPEIENIIALFVNKEKISTKKGIIELTQKFGKHIVWNILKLQNSDILSILLEN
jgi:hypothetical protein